MRTQRLEQGDAQQPEVIVAKSRESRVMRHLFLVLCAAEIGSTLRCNQGTWYLRVNAIDAAKAQQEIHEYQTETQVIAAPAETRHISPKAAVLGSAIYALILGTVMYAQHSEAYGDFLKTAGQMQSSAVRNGHLWRCVTALTLHQDAAHLAGNLVMGIVYGWMVTNRLGAGVGWLATVLAASFGNLLCGLVRPEGHTSIGASTAVFAGLGILAAEATVTAKSSDTSTARRWLPLISGCVLFAWTGTGGSQTDVLAHLAGFSVGATTGVLITAPPAPWSRWLWNNQLACAGVAVGTVIASWILAIKQ